MIELGFQKLRKEVNWLSVVLLNGTLSGILKVLDPLFYLREGERHNC